MESIKISVFSLASTNYCVEAKDGEPIFASIAKTLYQNQPVEISFQNVDMVTTAFLNTAIAPLYREFSEEKIKDLVKVVDINPADSALLRRVIETAKIYFKDPTWLENSVKEIMGDAE